MQGVNASGGGGVGNPASPGSIGSLTPVNSAAVTPTPTSAAAPSPSPIPPSGFVQSSSTPIRIGSAKHASTAGAGGDALVPPGGGAPSAHSLPGTPQQSSSVPTVTGSHLQLQTVGTATPSALSIAASNQSLGVSGISVGAGSTISGISITPPNSAGLRQASVFDFKFKRRPSQKVLFTKLPSSDSLSNSPAPSSPGIANWATDNRGDGNQGDKSPADASKLNRKESYKAQRKNYRREKKRVASELMNSLQDPAVIVLADWLKVRGTLKSWTKLWCVLKPGLLLIYKSQKTKSSHWVGTVMLTSCQVIERPSKKDGFCFKLFHPLEQSIWAPRGPDKETLGAVVQPLPTAYLIFRAPSQAAGKCWMDALELSLRCSALLLRSNSSTGAAPSNAYANETIPVSHETQWSEADYEKHFNEHELLFGLLQRSQAQYLALPSTSQNDATDHSRSDTSLPSRAQSPLLQQLYTSALSSFHRKRRSRAAAGNNNNSTTEMEMEMMDMMSSRKASLSDTSSVERGLSPMTVQMKRRRHHHSPIIKSMSLGAAGGGNASGSSTTDDEEEDDRISTICSATGSPRPVSAPPNYLTRPKYPQFRLNVMDLDADSQNEAVIATMSGQSGQSETESDGPDGAAGACELVTAQETSYVPCTEEEFGAQGEQVEELADENKSLIWCIVKQVRPGMDLSKVVLPTFILEPRSFLDKLSDSYYHADILSKAVQEDDAFTRMKYIVQWYLSSFYKKPKGLKKPYNPILGETFRCYWQHPSGSRTFYIAEQVSHHPPVSAFYVTNREDGFSITCSILAKSKFYGNSTSAVLEGAATLTLLPRGECYTLTTPYAHCKGILMGTLSMELGGKVGIECENTGYKTELEFKLKPFLGGSDATNVVSGKIKLGKETLATIGGHWDKECRIKDSKTGEDTQIFKVDAELRSRRLTRYLVPVSAQLPTESERLWSLVSDAIDKEDQIAATEQKTLLEERQRHEAKHRGETGTHWDPHLFELDSYGNWMYKYADLRPWDPRNDVRQYESDYKVLTQTRHKSVSIEAIHPKRAGQETPVRPKAKNKTLVIGQHETNSDSSQSPQGGLKRVASNATMKQLLLAVEQVNHALDNHSRQLREISQRLERMQYAPLNTHGSSNSMSPQSLLAGELNQITFAKAFFYAMIAFIISLLLRWLFK